MATEGKIIYITKEKLQELKKEHEKLVVFERNKTVGQEAPRILESEDMNPEFVSFQEDMDSLRSRIDELEIIIENHTLIKNPPKEKRAFVDIGATVKVDVHGKQNEFMIVGTLEANPDIGKISNESPIGKALLGHKVGDQVRIELPTDATYKIKKIRYQVN